MENFQYRLTKIEERVAENEEKNNRAHEKFYGEFEKLRLATELNNSHYATLQETVNGIAMDVKTLMAKPGRAMDNLLKSVITAIGGAIGGAIILLVAQAISGG